MTSWGFRGFIAVHESKFGRRTQPLDPAECWKCSTATPDLAHVVHEYVAAVLGAELERRVRAAINEHQDGADCPGLLGRCAVLNELWDLLPEQMRPIALATP